MVYVLGLVDIKNSTMDILLYLFWFNKAAKMIIGHLNIKVQP